MYIHVYKFTNRYIHVYTFHEKYEHVCTMYMICLYYSIVYTWFIHVYTLYIHVYAEVSGFQMNLSGIEEATRAGNITISQFGALNGVSGGLNNIFLMASLF